jgi:predicted metal-binding protein
MAPGEMAVPGTALGAAAHGDLTEWCDRAVALGAAAATPMPSAKVVVAEWVRMKCLFGCDEPGVHKTCPPKAPPVEQTRRLTGEFERAILLEVGPFVGPEKSDDESRRLNDIGLALERELFLAGFYKAWLMGAGPCDACGACTRGDDCPTPERARPSMEGCGLDVYATARNAGRRIEVVRTRDAEYRFFALVLVD